LSLPAASQTAHLEEQGVMIRCKGRFGISKVDWEFKANYVQDILLWFLLRRQDSRSVHENIATAKIGRNEMFASLIKIVS
jgi:hypothetical protein